MHDYQYILKLMGISLSLFFKIWLEYFCIAIYENQYWMCAVLEFCRLMDLQTGMNITTYSGYTYARQWRWMNVPSNFSAYYIIMTVSYYAYNTYAGIDNIRVTPDFCPPIGKASLE